MAEVAQNASSAPGFRMKNFRPQLHQALGDEHARLVPAQAASNGKIELLVQLVETQQLSIESLQHQIDTLKTHLSEVRMAA